jgi:hypothetical protein
MAYAARLMNPTPWKVELTWDRGIVIVVPPFGSTELTMQQMDDFRPGKPGSADVRVNLDYFGVFLFDTDRSYDVQALETLRRSYAKKKEQYDATVARLQGNRAAAGIAPNADAFEDTLKMMGYVNLREQMESLKEGIAKFEETVKAAGEQSQQQQYDPARTVMVINPPREFPSVAAMEFFLAKNPDIKAKHEAKKGLRAPRGLSAMSESQKFLREDAAKEAAPETE